MKIGYTVTYIDWKCGKTKVMARLKDKKSLDSFLRKIKSPRSFWLESEINSIRIHKGFDYKII